MSRDYVVQPFRPPIDLRIDYGKELNAQQLEAATAPPGPALVIAGAGSGKTRTLVYRVAFLLEQGIPADRILLLTFTNKAAREMMGRVADLVGAELTGLWGGTFHSVGARILRQHAELAGFRSDFTILDREDARELIKACVDEFGGKSKGQKFPKPEALADLFSMAANRRTSPRDLVEKEYHHLEEWVDAVETLAAKYEARKRSVNGMDFDDLLLLWLKLLDNHTEVREHYQRRFQFVLVDEYQDTNSLQGELIDRLVARHQNIMAVGDDAQSIYSWRGANFQNILDFSDHHPGARIYKIETNYRSTPEVLACANAVIAANRRQYPKKLAAHRASGPLPVAASCENPGEQAGFVAQRVVELSSEGVSPTEMAVLYRSHFHALELQLELTRRGIPYVITSGIRFFEQAHIKDVSAYLKLLSNPRDEVAFKRVVVLLPGIGVRGADKLWRRFAAEWRGRAGGEKGRTPLAPVFACCSPQVAAKATVGWAALSATFHRLESEEFRGRPARMIAEIMESGYEEILQQNYDRYQSRRDDLAQFEEFSAQFGNLEDLLTQLALLSDAEAEGQTGDAANRQAVRLSTVHQAKGLEFEVVFVIMLCDGLFPSARSIEERDGEEEERRLFYVAVTRAKTHLHLIWPRTRFVPGGGGLPQAPSRFLQELPEGSVELWNLRHEY